MKDTINLFAKILFDKDDKWACAHVIQCRIRELCEQYPTLDTDFLRFSLSDDGTRYLLHAAYEKADCIFEVMCREEKLRVPGLIELLQYVNIAVTNQLCLSAEMIRDPSLYRYMAIYMRINELTDCHNHVLHSGPQDFKMSSDDLYLCLSDDILEYKNQCEIIIEHLRAIDFNNLALEETEFSNSYHMMGIMISNQIKTLYRLFKTIGAKNRMEQISDRVAEICKTNILFDVHIYDEDKRREEYRKEVERTLFPAYYPTASRGPFPDWYFKEDSESSDSGRHRFVRASNYPPDEWDDPP